MNDKDWMILSVLNEERNITKAAERLFISQPALSYRIHQLEDYFGSHLFIRNRMGLQLTPQGEFVVGYAQKMIKQLQEAKETIQAMETEVKGTIKLGASSTVSRYMLPGMLRSFLNEYPKVEVNVVTGFSSDVEQKLAAGDIHIAIIRGDRHWHEKKMLLTSEPLLVASKKPVDIEELPELPGIYYKTDSSLKDLIDNWWKSIFNKPTRITMAVDNLETCKEMVKMELGYAILPGVCLQDEKELFAQPLYHANGEPVKRETWVCCRDSSLHFAAVKSFFDFFAEADPSQKETAPKD